jgi:phage baseplate assembly protein V
MSLERATGELERTRANLLQVGVVAAADYANARLRVTLDGQASAWLPWTTLRAGGDRTWAAPEVGEQVLVACPDGDPAQGVILGSIYQADYAAPAAAATVQRTTYADGAVLEYDRATHKLKATLPTGGAADITAPGNVTVTAPTVTVIGNLAVTGSLTFGTVGNGGGTIYGSLQQINGSFTTDGSVTSTGDQVAGTVSQKNHLHTGVEPGAGNTGIPVQ